MKIKLLILLLALGSLVTSGCVTTSRNPRWRSLSLRNESEVDAYAVFTIGGRIVSSPFISAGAFKTEGFTPYDTGAPAQLTFTLEDKPNTKVSASFDTAKHYPDVPPNTREITTAYVLTKDRKIELRFIIDPIDGESTTVTIRSQPNKSLHGTR